MKKGKSKLRLFVQVFFFALIALISINHTLIEEGKGIPFLASASLHSVCPFGGVVSIYQYTVLGTFVKKIHESSFILMIIVFLLAVGFGPVFCGFVCPLGSFQEWIGKVGRKVFKKRYNGFIPEKIDKYLRYLRYGVFVWVSYMTAVTGKLAFSDVDPYHALFNFWTSEIAISGLVILGLTLIASLFVERPWCKYACPYGAVLGLSNLFRIFKIRRNTSTCISCRVCDGGCPMNIKISETGVVKDHQCITCMKCTSEETCPIPETVDLSIKGGVSR